MLILGDCLEVLPMLASESIHLSFWSPPYHVGKSYEQNQNLDKWLDMLWQTVFQHGRLLVPGGFMIVNINDILCFPDESLPRTQANLLDRKKSPVSKEDIFRAMELFPSANRRELAKICGCSEQTIQRRLEGNNIRGGRQKPMTRIRLCANDIHIAAQAAGLYLYDRRIWAKDPCWETSKWHSSGRRSVDEFEYLYIFRKPGSEDLSRQRLSRDEWALWGSRGVWNIRSVRTNKRHEAEFPEELAEKIIRLFSDRNDFILDPFAGTGTTCVMAKKLGRKWIGIEKEKKYFQIADERIKSQVAGLN